MEEKRDKNLLKELQSLDEPTKNKVLVISTVVIMVVVVFVWVAYFNSIVLPTAGRTATSTEASAGEPATAATGTSFWKNIENGFVSLFHGGRQDIKPSNQ